MDKHSSLTAGQNGKSSTQELAAFMACTPKRKQSAPAGSRSCMAPYWAEIIKLQGEGFSLARIQEYLEKANVKVSRNAIHKFLSLHTEAPSK